MRGLQPVVAGTFGFFLLLSASAQPLVDFPTENHTLLNGAGPDFFMYVQRDFEGVITNPWEGGQYGYVRGPRREGGGLIYTTLHEGVDIKPLLRDAAGNALDDVKATAAGKVAYINPLPGASNYGRYIVIEHKWDGSPYYSLYAHLAAITVKPGDTVTQGEVIGRMGCTGAGIDRARSHLHFEVNMLLSRNFEEWYKASSPNDPNNHGLFNGRNLSGLDPTLLLTKAAKNPTLRISDFIRSAEPAFKIVVKNSPHFSLIQDYPWLVPTGENASPPAWIITFAQPGFPIKIEAAKEAISEPRVVWVKPSSISYAHATRGLITGPPGSPQLSSSGKSFASLFTWPD